MKPLMKIPTTKKLIFAFAVLVLAVTAGRSEAAACRPAWTACTGECRVGGALCHAGATGSSLCDVSEGTCEARCASEFLDCANGGLPAN